MKLLDVGKNCDKLTQNEIDKNLTQKVVFVSYWFLSCQVKTLTKKTRIGTPLECMTDL